MSRDKTISFFVPGIPQPGGSKRGFQHKHTKRIIITEDNKKSKPWRDSVMAAAMAVHKGELLRGPVGIVITFVFPRPKGHFGSGKNAARLKASAPKRHTVKPDATKLMRSTEDALKGIVWADDSQICVQTVSKSYGAPCGAHVEIYEITEA